MAAKQELNEQFEEEFEKLKKEEYKQKSKLNQTMFNPFFELSSREVQTLFGAGSHTKRAIAKFQESQEITRFLIEASHLLKQIPFADSKKQYADKIVTKLTEMLAPEDALWPAEEMKIKERKEQLDKVKERAHALEETLMMQRAIKLNTEPLNSEVLGQASGIVPSSAPVRPQQNSTAITTVNTEIKEGGDMKEANGMVVEPLKSKRIKRRFTDENESMGDDGKKMSKISVPGEETSKMGVDEIPPGQALVEGVANGTTTAVLANDITMKPLHRKLLRRKNGLNQKGLNQYLENSLLPVKSYDRLHDRPYDPTKEVAPPQVSNDEKADLRESKDPDVHPVAMEAVVAANHVEQDQARLDILNHKKYAVNEAWNAVANKFHALPHREEWKKENPEYWLKLQKFLNMRPILLTGNDLEKLDMYEVYLKNQIRDMPPPIVNAAQDLQPTLVVPVASSNSTASVVNLDNIAPVFNPIASQSYGQFLAEQNAEFSFTSSNQMASAYQGGNLLPYNRAQMDHLTAATSAQNQELAAQASEVAQRPFIVASDMAGHVQMVDAVDQSNVYVAPFPVQQIMPPAVTHSVVNADNGQQNNAVLPAPVLSEVLQYYVPPAPPPPSTIQNVFAGVNNAINFLVNGANPPPNPANPVGRALLPPIVVPPAVLGHPVPVGAVPAFHPHHPVHVGALPAFHPHHPPFIHGGPGGGGGGGGRGGRGGGGGGRGGRGGHIPGAGFYPAAGGGGGAPAAGLVPPIGSVLPPAEYTKTTYSDNLQINDDALPGPDEIRIIEYAQKSGLSIPAVTSAYEKIVAKLTDEGINPSVVPTIAAQVLSSAPISKPPSYDGGMRDSMGLGEMSSVIAGSSNQMTLDAMTKWKARGQHNIGSQYHSQRNQHELLDVKRFQNSNPAENIINASNNTGSFAGGKRERQEMANDVVDNPFINHENDRLDERQLKRRQLRRFEGSHLH